MSTSKTKPSAGSARRVIKKYPNRRLYDTASSSYITLSEVKQLVMSHQPFVVVDAKTQEDLTRSILLQIILEEEAAGVPMFSEAVLSDMIRFYGHAMQGFMGSYLEKSMQALTQLQSTMTEQSKGLSPQAWTQFLNMQSPALHSALGAYAEQSQNALAQMQQQMLSAFGVKR